MFLASGCGGRSSGGLKSNGSFESIVDPPLESCESTNHEDSCHKACPESSEADFSIYFGKVLT